MGAVVANLEHVDRPQHGAGLEELLDRLLSVSGEQRAEAAEAQQADDRGVVDVIRGEGRLGVSRAGVPDLEDGSRVEVQSLTGAGEDVPRSRFDSRQSQEALVARVRVRTAAIKDRSHAKPAKDIRQATHVVLVGMRQDHDVDRALPPRKRRAELPERPVGVRARVDQHGPACWGFH
jgi:hypothetical protein